ncbi:GIY-YIG nuclease family protein [Shewanella sp. SR43-8]|nr:GIY-YIG nuclease family protein [Shewanella sp. SR43-8]|tara:strand:+ start:6597 stop:6941 length:345 start_codon:yes stop_codon:yes gene_type:complete
MITLKVLNFMPKNNANAGWFLYIIRCANSHLYTGITTDIARRFAEHQTGSPKAAKYLKGKGPLTLVYQESLADRSEASKRESAIKKLSRQQKLVLIEQHQRLGRHSTSDNMLVE